MDNLRGLDSDRSLLDDIEGDYIVDDAGDAGLDRPPAIGTDERRMQVRAYNFWTRLLTEHDFPLIESLDPASAMDFGDHAVLLDFTDGLENPAIGYVGPAIATECELNGPVTRLDQVHPRSLLSRITDHHMQIHANRAPIGFEAEFVNQRGATILYRGILLPFSSDGSVIDYIYGVINWKEAVGGAEAEELQLEVSQALDHVPDPTPPAMPAWADGPVSKGDALTSGSIIDAFWLDEVAEQPFFEPTIADGLTEWLHAARSAAEAADIAERRSREALYQAIGRAYDFHLMAERDPGGYAELLDDAGLTVQARAPFTPVVKLVFGAGYDKTRLAEYATVLAAAHDAGIGIGECTDWIAGYKGGVKAIVADARAPKSDKPSAPPIDVREALRVMPSIPMSEYEGGDGEFAVLVVRRGDNGRLEVVGALEDNMKLTEEAMKSLIR